MEATIILIVSGRLIGRKLTLWRVCHTIKSYIPFQTSRKACKPLFLLQSMFGLVVQTGTIHHILNKSLKVHISGFKKKTTSSYSQFPLQIFEK